MKKKLTALFLALVMCMTMSAPALAVDIASTDAAELEAVIQAEIESEKARIFADVHRQLNAQDAVDMMNIYIDILEPEIEFCVRAKYNNDMAIPLEEDGYTFRKGGIIGYTSSNGAHVLTSYMTPAQFSGHILSKLGENVATTVLDGGISAFLEYHEISLSSWGWYFTALSTMDLVVDFVLATQIYDAGGYAKVIEAELHDDYSSIMVIWENPPYATVPAGSTGIKAANCGYDYIFE